MVGASLGAAGMAWDRSPIDDVSSAKALRLSSSEYPLINPLLLCNIEPRVSEEDKNLEAVIQHYVDEAIAKGTVDHMSVYIANYGKSSWVGVNENERYDPASMLKIPLMIAFYQEAQKNPGILKQIVSFNGDDQNDGEYFRSHNNIKPGKEYTVDQLIDSMVANSDNTAAILLQQEASVASLAEVYTDLGLPLPKSDGNVQYLSAKLYAFFFRVLYNGTYLDREYSQKALELLTKTTFQGIRAGVPSGVTVADKFGERTAKADNGRIERELHDCGVVYKTGNPYLLCIMSRSATSDFPALQKNLSDLSALVYDAIDK